MINTGGVGMGGELDIFLAGIHIIVDTEPGDSANRVAGLIAQAISGNATLNALGITALVDGPNVILANSTVTSASTTDPGVTVGVSSTVIPDPEALPSLPQSGFVVLLAALIGTVILKIVGSRNRRGIRFSA